MKTNMMGFVGVACILGTAFHAEAAPPKGWSKTKYSNRELAAKDTAAYLFNKGAAKASNRLGTPLTDLVPLEGRDFGVTLSKRARGGNQTFKAQSKQLFGGEIGVRLSSIVRKFPDGWHGKTSASPRIQSDYQP